MLIRTCLSEIDFPEPIISRGFCGCLNFFIPVSTSGLIEIIEAPFFLASLNAVNILG